MEFEWRTPKQDHRRDEPGETHRFPLTEKGKNPKKTATCGRGWGDARRFRLRSDRDFPCTDCARIEAAQPILPPWGEKPEFGVHRLPGGQRWPEEEEEE